MPSNSKGETLGFSDISKISTKSWLGLPTTRWTESKDFLEFKQAPLDETAFPICPDQACIPFSHWLLLLFLSCKENAFVYLSQTLTKGETYSSYYGFLEITSSWSWDKLIFHLHFSEGLGGSEFIKVFLSSEILMNQFLSKTYFWICNFTAACVFGRQLCSPLQRVFLITHLVPNSTSEITILF